MVVVVIAICISTVKSSPYTIGYDYLLFAWSHKSVLRKKINSVQSTKIVSVQ